MDPRTVRQVERLTALKTALADRNLLTRLDVLPIPFLVLPVLHLTGHHLMVHVVLGHAAPDTYTWAHGNHHHETSDPPGAADRITTHVRGHRDDRPASSRYPPLERLPEEVIRTEGADVRQPLFTGVGVALVTLFDEDGELDAKATGTHAARLVDAGVRAIVTAGSTGEAAALSADERIAVLEAVRSAVPDSVPVFAGTGAPSPRQAGALTADARAHGADAVLALAPPGSRRLGDYYGAVADAADEVPVLGYHFPSVSAPGIPLAELGQLPLHGIKDSSADPERLLAELDGFDGWIYVGSSALLSYAGALECSGAILQLANAEPELCVAAFGGDIASQRELLPFHLEMRRDPPRTIKRMAADKYGVSPVCRV